MNVNYNIEKPLQISEAAFRENVTTLIASGSLSYPFLLIENKLYKSQGILIRDLIEDVKDGIPLCALISGKLFKLKTVETNIHTIYKLCLLLNNDIRLVISENESLLINQQKMLELGVLDIKQLINKDHCLTGDLDQLLKEIAITY